MRKFFKISPVIVLFFLTASLPVQGQVITDRNELENCFCDSSINNLKLESDLSPFLTNLQLDGCDPDCRKKYFNADKTETLELFFYPGRINNHCSYFKVSLASTQPDADYEQLPDDQFISGSGIKLLDTFEKVRSLLNNEIITIEKKGNITIITFDGSKQNESRCKAYFDTRHIDISLYRSIFTFKNEILIAFEFGYDYL
jgi:hypothetical protein